MRGNSTTPEKTKRVAPANGLAPDLAPFARSGASMIENASELAQEMMGFSQSCVEAGMDAWQAFAACRSPADLLECQRQFVERSTARSFEQASKLGARFFSAMSSAAAAFRSAPASGS